MHVKRMDKETGASALWNTSLPLKRILPFATKEFPLETTKFSEISQLQKDKYRFSLI